MFGLDVIAAVCGIIAAIRVLPEIPKVWRGIFGEKKNSKMDMTTRRSTQKVKVNSRGDRVYESTMTTLRQYDDNRTTIHLSNNNVLQSFDRNRHLSQTQSTELLRDVLYAWQDERIMFFNRVMLDQQIIICLLVLVVVLAYFLGKYTTYTELLRVPSFALRNTAQVVVEPATCSGTCPNDPFLLYSAPPPASIFTKILGAAQSLFQALLMLPISSWRAVVAATTWLGLNVGLLLGATLGVSFHWIGKVFRLLLGAGQSSLKVLMSVPGFSQRAAVAAAGWFSQNVRLLFRAIFSLPFKWIGKMLLLFLGAGAWLISSSAMILMTVDLVKAGLPKGRMPLGGYIATIAGAAAGGWVMHYFDFSTSVCMVVALVPALFWNGIGVAMGVELR